MSYNDMPTISSQASDTPSKEQSGRHGSRLQHGEAHTCDHHAWSRRDFLQALGVTGLAVPFMASGIPAYAHNSSPLLRLMEQADKERTLVLIKFDGGNDGLNMVVPHENDLYYNARPTIAIPKEDTVNLDDLYGLPSTMEDLKPLWEEGSMSVIHGAGYPRSTRSHFTGQQNWETGTGDYKNSRGSHKDLSYRTGWIGRYLENTEPVLDPVKLGGDPLAVSLGGARKLYDISGGRNLSIGKLRNPTVLQRILEDGSIYPTDNLQPDTPLGQSLTYTREATNTMLSAVTEFVEQTSSDNTPNKADYRNGRIDDELALTARIVRSRLSPRVISLSTGGFDTHDGQGDVNGGHANRLGSIAQSIADFLADLAADGLDKKVLVMTFSEFGRQLYENGSQGTDHGTAGPMLLFGPGLKGGFYSEFPSLKGADLRGDAPRHTIDYRRVYATLLQDWFGVPPATVDASVGYSFERLDTLVEAKQDSSTGGDTPPTEALIEKVQVEGTSDGYTFGTLAEGTQCYGDRGHTISSVPDALTDALFIRLLDADWQAGGDSYLEFNLKKEGTLHVAYDSRANKLPAWLSDWEDTGEQLGLEGEALKTDHLNLYSKTFAPGVVTLGGNLAEPAEGAQLNYLVAALKGNATSDDDLPEEPTSTSSLPFVLNQNYPNPFQATTRIEYRMNEPGEVRLRVYDMRGRLVATLVNDQQEKGLHTQPFDAAEMDLASGVYIYRLEAHGKTLSRKMTLVK